MNKTVRLLKALADENRLRLLLLLKQREMFVCQLMAVTGLSQPLISHGLALLEREGLLVSRRQGKHVFYRLAKSLPVPASSVVAALGVLSGTDIPFGRDRQSLRLFWRKFQRGKAACDMTTIRKFIEFKNKKP